MKLLADKQGLSLSLPAIFEISTTATFYGLILPGTLSGGFIRWYKLAKQGGPVGALAALTWDRLADATLVALVGIICWCLSRPAAPHAVAPGCSWRAARWSPCTSRRPRAPTTTSRAGTLRSG
jgi:hypothetical protein